MREHLFRGKRTDNGEWVKGDLIHAKRRSEAVCWIMDSMNGSEWGRRTYSVNPDTVGEYAGLADQTGKRVFEGDILGWIARYGLLRGIVRFGRYQNPVNDDGYSIGWHMEWIEGDEPHMRKELAYWIENGLRVQGNVHENFDLLKPTY